MVKKAYFFSVDALIATIFIIIIMLIIPIFYSSEKTNINLEYTSRDIATILSSTKVSEISDPVIEQYILDKKITNINNSILEQIAEFWTQGQKTEATNITKSILSNLTSLNYDYAVVVENEIVYNSSVKSIDYLITTKRLMSGVAPGQQKEGWLARVWLRRISNKTNTQLVKGDIVCGGYKNYAWGWYCGKVNNTILYQIKLPSDAKIKDAYWFIEPSWTPQVVTAYINDVKVFGPANVGYSILLKDLESYLHSGNNTARIIGDVGGDDGASHFVIDYETSEIQTYKFSQNYNFEEVKSNTTLHYEKPFFSPTLIQSMNVHLNTTHRTDLYFSFKGNVFNINNKTPVNNITDYPDSEIKASLLSHGISYSDLKDNYFWFIVDVGSNDQKKKGLLHKDSYVNINLASLDLPYNSIDISEKIPVINSYNWVERDYYRNVIWQFRLPENSTSLMADFQLSWLSSVADANQHASSNYIDLYKHPPQNYIPAFTRFGYTPNSANNAIINGLNRFELNFSSGYSVSNNNSIGMHTFFVLSSVGYKDVFDKAQGSTKTITFEDGTTQDIVVGNSTDPWDPSLDAIDDATERLLDILDFDKDGKIDIKIGNSDLDLDSLKVANVPSMWGPSLVEVRIWQ